MSLSRTIDLQHTFVTGDFEIPIYAASNRAKIEEIIFVFEKSVAKDAIDYTDITVIDKGVDGTGTDIVLTITTNSGDIDAIDISGFIPIIFELDYDVPKGTVLSIEKEDSNDNIYLGVSTLLINERRY